MISIILRILLGILFLLMPLFFLPITQEFFVTQKMFSMLFVSLLMVTIITINFVFKRKLTYTHPPFLKLLTAFTALAFISTFMTSTNVVQALTLLPTGVIVFGTLYLLYVVAMIAAGNLKKSVHFGESLFTYLLAGLGIAGLISVIFSFNPFGNSQLPTNLQFLQNSQFSVLGNTLDTALLLGFGTVAGIAYIYTYLRSKDHTLTHGQTLIIGIASLAMILGLTTSALSILRPVDPTQNVLLPPASTSWAASVETLKNPTSALLGAGNGDFASIFTSVKTPSYNQMDYWNRNFALSRSALLHIWTVFGSLAFIAIIGIIFVAAHTIRTLYSKKNPYALVYSTTGIYLALILLVFPPSALVFTISVMYLILLSLIHAQYAQTPRHSISAKGSSGQLVTYIAGVVIIMLVLYVGYHAQRAHAAERAFKQALNGLQENSGEKVYTNLRKAILLNPAIEKYHLQFSQMNLLLAQGTINQAEDGQITDEQRQNIAQFIQQAISEAKYLVNLNPTRGAYWFNLARTYQSIIGIAEQADAWSVSSYQEAIRRDPMNPQYRISFGGLLYAREQYTEAAEIFRQAVSLKPDNANAHYNFAWALYQAGNYQNAVAAMENVLLLVADDTENKAIAERDLATFKESAEEAEENTASTPKSEIDVPNVDELPEETIEQEPLTLPENDTEASISPALELPEDAGPESN